MSQQSSLYTNFIGRPTPLYHAKTLSKHFGANIYLKREDLNHTGSVHINNALKSIYKLFEQKYKKIHLQTKSRDFAIACAALCARLQIELQLDISQFDELSIFKLNLFGVKNQKSYNGSQDIYLLKDNQYSDLIPRELTAQIDKIDSFIVVSDDMQEAVAMFGTHIKTSKCICVGELENKNGIFRYEHIDLERSKEAFMLLARSEGIVTSFKSSLVLAYLMENKPLEGENIVIVLNENGDKDMVQAFEEIAL